MLVITADLDRLEYDIRALVTSFYPEEEVDIIYDPNLSVKNEEADPAAFSMRLCLLHEPAFLLFEGKRYTYERAFCEENGTLAGEEKKTFKAFFYKALSEHTKKTLPWGNLTGIRPTKIAMKLLEEGASEDQIDAFLKERHFVSEKKRLLCIDIAKRERKILQTCHAQNGYSLYIGIPFCPSRCLYCSFTSNPIAQFAYLTDLYVDCLIREMELVAHLFGQKTLETVYVGGGTPTTLSGKQLKRLLSELFSLFDTAGLKELTVEAGRPDSITEEKLAVLRESGVTRISVNPQTMHDTTLSFIGRKHTTEDVREAYRMARAAGFDNINMDLILGLPGEGEAEVAETMEEIRALDPDSLTVHSLAIKRASRLREWIEKNGRPLLKNTDACMEIASMGAAQMEMKPYYLYRQKNMAGNFENVGYAKDGKYGIYNILIMEEMQSIMAVGAGSVSKAVYPDGRIERADNVKDVKLYIDKIDEMLARKKALAKELEEASDGSTGGSYEGGAKRKIHIRIEAAE